MKYFLKKFYCKKYVLILRGVYSIKILKDYFGKKKSLILKDFVRLYWFCEILKDFLHSRFMTQILMDL